MINNKNHWYDGSFYDRIIAPNQDMVFGIVKKIIEPDSAILDAGCGTGRLAFKLDEKFSLYDGVDLSIRNINSANKNLSQKPSHKINFYHADVFSFLQSRSYDYAVISFVIHEINEAEREKILITLTDHAKEVIIIEYLSPRPPGFWSILNEAVEFIAGKEHYRNFKSFIAAGGIYGIAERTGLKIIKEIKNSPYTTHIAVLTK